MAVATLAAGLLLLVAVAVGVTAAATPGCVSCHSNSGSLVARTRATAHAGVDCRSCHVPDSAGGRLVFASRQVFGMTLRVAPGDRAAASVPDERCLKCHREVTRKVTASKGLRINHRTCAAGTCSSCHSGTAHGTDTGWVRSAEMGDCLGCHTAQKASKDCGLCHDERTKRERLAKGAWNVTHGPQWKNTHGMGDLRTCAACHPQNYCVRCHSVALPHESNYVKSHSDDALKYRSACNGCHAKVLCDSCHGVVMPHPSWFLGKHSTQVERLGKKKCLKCHVQADCSDCHVKHVHPGGAIRKPKVVNP